MTLPISVGTGIFRGIVPVYPVSPVYPVYPVYMLNGQSETGETGKTGKTVGPVRCHDAAGGAGGASGRNRADPIASPSALVAQAEAREPMEEGVGEASRPPGRQVLLVLPDAAPLSVSLAPPRTSASAGSVPRRREARAGLSRR